MSNEDPVDAAARLERALERIAALAAQAQAAKVQAAALTSDQAGAGLTSPAASSVDIPALAARLDGLISQLRTALGPQAGS